MKKTTYYEETIQQEYTQILCDTCGKSLSVCGGIVREIGSAFPVKLMICDIDYDFCSYKCLLNFIVEELKKEKDNV